MSLAPSELFFSIDRLIAVFSLLFLVFVILIIIFLLFFHQRNASGFNEHELVNEREPASGESRVLDPARDKGYAATVDISDELARSRTNLVASK